MTSQRWLVAYDISHDSRRLAVATRLQAIGDRIQRSVFVISLPKSSVVALEAELRTSIDPTCDAIHLVPLCQTCHDTIIQIGQAHLPSDDVCWIVT